MISPQGLKYPYLDRVYIAIMINTTLYEVYYAFLISIRLSNDFCLLNSLFLLIRQLSLSNRSSCGSSTSDFLVVSSQLAYLLRHYVWDLVLLSMYDNWHSPAHSILLNIRKCWMFGILNSFLISEFFPFKFSIAWNSCRIVHSYILLRTFLLNFVRCLSSLHYFTSGIGWSHVVWSLTLWIWTPLWHAYKEKYV